MRLRQGLDKLSDRWRRVVNVINAHDSGKLSVNGTFTLAASASTTTVKDYRVGKDSVVLLMPLTANAASALSSTYIGSSDIDSSSNQFTVNHANNAQTDRDFRYIVIGSSVE